MDEIKINAKNLRKAIEETKEFQEYIRLKKLYEDNESIRVLLQNIQILEKKNKFEEKENLTKIYNANPLVSNYASAKKELAKLLSTISDIVK